jgi:hypothetical protein
MRATGTNLRKSVKIADGTATNPAVANASGSGKTAERSTGFFARPPSATINAGDGFPDETFSLNERLAQLEKDLERRQESYIARERAYKIRIDELEEEVASQRESKTGWMKTDSKISKLKTMHSQILNNVELVQDRAARILQEQERDLLRAFRARLFDVQTELEKEKSKKDDGAAAWIERSRQLEAEVEWAKEVADRLERVNQTLLQENNRLKSQFTSQEEDRNFLIKQLVAVKKDNARLRAEYTELEADSDQLKMEVKKLSEFGPSMVGGGIVAKSGLTAAGSPVHSAHVAQESEERLKEINVRLRRLLAEERKSTRDARQNYEKERGVRTDMELLLRQCVEDVRKEIARRCVEEGQFHSVPGNDLAKLYGKQPQLIPVEDFSQADRERVLELLLSQERVVSLLYAKTFPLAGTAAGKALQAMDSGAAAQGNSRDLLQLLEGERPGSPSLESSSSGAGAAGAPSKVPTLPAVNSGASSVSNRVATR